MYNGLPCLCNFFLIPEKKKQIESTVKVVKSKRRPRVFT